MSESKRLLMERELEQVNAVCTGCQGRTTARECIRCAESFQRCEQCDDRTLCEYCEHVSSKDD